MLSISTGEEVTPLPLTLVLQAPTEDALRQLMSDFPTLPAAAERTGCRVSLVADDGHPHDLAEFLIDTPGRG